MAEPYSPEETTLGYIVIEFNQASGQPALRWAELYETAELAQADCDRLAAETHRIGRRESYKVGTVTIEEEGN